MSHHVIGIDLGGTNARCAIVDEDRKILARAQTPTNASEGADRIIDKLADMVHGVLAEAGMSPGDIRGICVGAPGPLNGETGVVIEAPNLGWRNVPIAAILKEKTGIHVILENDANAAGWGEYWAGAGRGCQHMLMMTLGTGVGGAIVLDGKLHRGPDWTAGEIGHVVVQDGGRACGCGGNGCLEAYASATATVARFREGLGIGWHSLLSDRDPATITCADIFGAAQEQDPLAMQIVAGTGRYLGLMAASMANLLNIERCVFSGGMIQAGDLLFDAIRAEAEARPFKTPVSRMEILPAELGGDAGLIGAAGCVFTAIPR